MTTPNDKLAAEAAKVTVLHPPRPARKFGDLVLRSVDDILTAKPREYIVKGLLGSGELSVISGPPKCGKSFAALHIAYAVARGHDVWGRRVKQRPVLYVALEGEGGFSKRLRALVQTVGKTDAFMAITQPCPLFRNRDLANDIIAAAQSIDAGLIVIDTHARAMTGGDESTAKDTGEIVGLYDQIRTATAAHVLIIHHTGKVLERGMRGSTALAGAADAGFVVAKDEAAGTHAIEVDFAKDDASGDALNFKLAVVEVGEPDEDGDPVTTCLVEELGAVRIDRGQKAPRLTPKERIWFEKIVAVFSDRPEAVLQTRPRPDMPVLATVTRETLREYLEAEGVLLRNGDGNAEQVSNRNRVNLHRKLESLQAKGVIGFSKDRVWLAGGDGYDAG